MSDAEFDAIMRRLRKKKGFCPLTPEEAQKAYDEAVPVPVSNKRIEEIVNYVLGARGS